MISHLLNIVYGIVFGVANIIPGVSGGTMMVVFGVYDKVVDVLTLKLSAIKKNIRFIVFFGIGAVIGILGFSFVITWLFDNFPVATNMFFMGLIIGSIPLIYRNMTVGGRKITPKCLFAFIPALALVATWRAWETGPLCSSTTGTGIRWITMPEPGVWIWTER